jgi:Domain of unknown function (DUF4037)
VSFHDPAGELETVRAALAWYPDDLWLWLLACQWRRLDQEEPFTGRTAEVGDEIGSRTIAARLGRDLVRLCLLLDALAATEYKRREAALVAAFVATRDCARSRSSARSTNCGLV